MRTKKLVSVDDLNFGKADGLVPVIVQDCDTLKVLTLAYADRDAIEKTIETGYAHFFRRSFHRVMKKGETSGNVQVVKKILVDCDHDTILYLVKSSGPACHLGEKTCFHNKLKEEQRKQVL